MFMVSIESFIMLTNCTRNLLWQSNLDFTVIKYLQIWAGQILRQNDNLEKIIFLVYRKSSPFSQKIISESGYVTTTSKNIIHTSSLARVIFALGVFYWSRLSQMKIKI